MFSRRVGDPRDLRGYLEGYTFTVVTDHQALRWLQKMDSPTDRLRRWTLKLQQYTFDVQYRRGSLNRVADALSSTARKRCPSNALPVVHSPDAQSNRTT